MGQRTEPCGRASHRLARKKHTLCLQIALLNVYDRRARRSGSGASARGRGLAASQAGALSQLLHLGQEGGVLAAGSLQVGSGRV